MNKGYIPTTMVTKLFKRALIEENEIKFVPKLRMGQDLNFSRNCLLNANSFYYLPDLKLYKYIHNEHSRTNTYLDSAWEILKEGVYQSYLLSNKFPEYKLEKQISYALVSSSMTAILNISKNGRLSNREDDIKELEQIIYDPELQNALNIISTKYFNYERKLLVKLLKGKKIKLIYITVFLEKIRRRIN